MKLPCGDRPLPAGRLLGLRPPQLQDGESAGFSVMLPGGRQEIVAWIRDYEAEFAETYWLRTPLELPKEAVCASRRPDPAWSPSASRRRVTAAR